MRNLGLGITEAAKAFTQGDVRAAQRAEAKLRIKQADAMTGQVDERADIELQQLRNQARQANAATVRQMSFDAFTRYQGDNDVRHLNNFFKEVRKNPMGKQFANTVRVEPLTKNQQNDNLLRKAGFNNPDEVYKDPKLASQFVVAVRPDGTTELSDMEQVYAATGFTRHMQQQQLQDLERTARVKQLLRQGSTLTQAQQMERVVQSLMENEEGLSYAEAYSRARDMLSSARSAESQMINRIAQEENVGILEATEMYYSRKNQGGRRMSNEQAFVDNFIAENPGASYTEAVEAYAARTPTSTQKEIGDVDTIKDELDNMKFFEKDLNNISTQERAKLHRKISQIEDLRGVQLSTEDRRLLRDFRNLTSLGQTVGSKITDEETGIIDRMLNKFKSYVNNEVGGKEATSAYESFRNIFRNALYGATLTQAEIDVFNSAAGTLGQQTKPLLAQFKTQMQSVKDQLEAMRDYNDPYLAHYYTGSSVDNVDEVIRAIDERLNAFTGKVGGGAITSENAGEVINNTNNERPSLDELLGTGGML